ncbi:MAG TPA: Cthe_2314 family HEPN domain-containing protein [Thermoanaerobaculia bacterium]|jgi:hypothetical protein|nr:Cthe_2314 family HEPN domain-containing protein [Thermoanaerobaculia bacterium]
MNRLKMLDAATQDEVAVENGYEMQVFGRCFDLSAAFGELEHLLELLLKATTFEEISLLIKLYIIGWVALSDVLGNVLNEVFDLGYADRDVQFGVILRNQKILRTQLPEIIRQHARTIDYDRYVKRRNDIVHRGTLDDAELKKVRGKVLSAVILKTIHVDQSDAVAVAAAMSEALLEVRAGERIRELVEQKRSEFSQHLAATHVMLQQVGIILVERINAQPRYRVTHNENTPPPANLNG